MPGQTTNYGIRYPCPGDTIDAEAFGVWTNDIENAMAQVQTASNEALQRPRAMVRTANAGFAIPVGVATQITYTTTVYNNAGATPFAGTIPPEEPQLNLYMAQITPIGTGTTVTSWKASILVDNFVVASRTSASSAASTIAKPISLVGLGFRTADPGGAAVVTFHWTGTGGPLNVYSQFSFSYVAPATP